MKAKEQYPNLIEWYNDLSRFVPDKNSYNEKYAIINEDIDFDNINDCQRICDQLNDLLTKLKEEEIINIEDLEKISKEFIKQELPDSNLPFHYEAEAAHGIKDFIKWIKELTK